MPVYKLPKGIKPATSKPPVEGNRGAGYRPQQVSGRQPGGNLDYWINNPPPGYRVAPGAGSYPAVNRAPFESYPRQKPQETPFISADDMMNQMPNAEMLTPSERWLYNTLPRVMDTQVFGKPLGDRFEDFNEGWAGKALNALDIPAEGLERGFGFLSQWSDANLYGTDQDKEEFNNQLSEAWYAGGLWSDMTNLPGFKRDEEGKVTGLTIPGQLPGRAGIVNARRRLAELTAQGVEHGEALKQVRTEYYNDLGALSIRAQVQDTYQHILLDPLNVLAAYLKPVEAIKARSVAAITGKVDNLDDLARFAAEAAEKAKELKGLGKLDEAASMADDAVKITERLESLKDMPQIDKLDQMALWLTGDDPFKPAATTLTGKIGEKLPWRLTSDAKAHEMLTIVSDNIDSYILSRLDDPEDIMDAIYRAERGALGPEYGHAFLTKEGRMSQAALTAAKADADNLFSAWQTTAGERRLLEDIARMTGDDVPTLVRSIEDGNVGQIVGRLQELGEDGVRLSDNITDDFVEMVSTFTKSEIPLNPQMFKLQLSNAVRDSTAQMAIARFGLKSRGLVMKFSQTLKSAETLAFLRINPTFVMKNLMNNEMTLIARGLGWAGKNISPDEFTDLIGFTPHRFGQAFAVAGEHLGIKLGTGEQAIADVLRGEKGFLNKADDMFRKAGDKLGPLDMGKWASKMEANASQRAFMHGYLQGWNRYFWKPGTGYKTMAQSIPVEILDDMPAGFARSLERRIQGLYNEEQLRGVADLDNLNRTTAGLADDIVKEYGYNLDDRFGANTIANLNKDLEAAMPRGRPAVRRVIEEAREQAQNHLDEMAEAAHQNRIDEIAASVELTGPEGLLKAWGDAIDEIHGGQLAYDVRMSKIDPSGLTGEAANLWWNRTFEDTNAFWDRQWTRFDEVVQGMKKGAKNIKDTNGKSLNIPGDVSNGYTQLRKNAQGFITNRNKLWKQYFDAITEGKAPKIGYAEIKQTLFEDYQKLMQNEYNLTTSIDDAITGMVRKSSPDKADAFSAIRKRARDLRLEKRQKLSEFRQSIEGMDPRGKQDAWNGYWEEIQKMDEAVWRNDAAAKAILEGDPKAVGAGQIADEMTGASAGESVRDVANRYGIESATAAGDPLDDIPRRTVNKYLRGEYDEVVNVGEEVTDFTRKPISSMTSDEFYKTLDAAKEGDQGMLIDLFGEEGAKKYKSAEIMQNSADPDRADKGYKAVKSMEEQLTESQQNRLFGIGEEGYTYEELVEYRSAFDDISDMPEEFLIDEIRRNITKITPEDVEKIIAGDVDSAVKEIAYVKMRRSINTLVDRGLDPDDIMGRAFVNLADELEVNDAKFIFESWIDAGKKATADATPTAKTPFAEVQAQFRAKVDEFTTTPRHEIDPVVSNAIEDEAYRMLSQVEEGVPGERVFEDGKFARELESTYPNWYGSLPGTKRQTVINALNKIIKDEGADVGVTVERLKYIGMNNLLEGAEADVRILRAVGREEEAFKILHEGLQSGKIDDIAEQLGSDIEDMFAWYGESLPKYTDEAGNYISPDDIDFTPEEIEIPGLGEKPPLQDWQQYDDIADITPELAEEAFEARRQDRIRRGFDEPDPTPPPDTPPQEFSFAPGAEKIIDDAKAMNPPIAVGSDQQWLGNGFSGLDDIEREVLKRMDEPVVNMSTLTEEQGAVVQRYLRQVEGQMADAKLASTKYGEFKRDSGLLNYNRRYNYNNWLSTIMPFEFWTTQSLAKWALHSIDRPAMLTTYLRMKKLIETAGMKQNGFPSRLQGSLRVGVPFMPEWMGGKAFINPMRTLLPFDNWASAYEQYTGDQRGLEGRTERLLASMIEQGQISSEEGAQAMSERAGPVWEQALAQAQQNDGEGMNDAFDYASMLLSPHAPYIWAKEIAQGTPENIGPLTPISRTMAQAFGALGVNVSQAKWNVGGNIRKELGLPAFDKWDDYRIDRELSNMATEGYNLTDIKLAMIERSGPLWDEASSRAAKTFSGGGGVPFLLKTLGIPTQAYPIGEQHQRALQDDFSKAYEEYDNGNVEALSNFFDDYPEYESRLALWDEPEERLRSFQVDNIWSQYHEMPSLHKRQLRDALGDEFQQYFLDKETRNYEAISNDTLQMWAKLMNGDPVGSLNSPTQPIQYADTDEAWRVQQFYDLRRSQYPHYNELQDVYFKLSDDAKKKYRSENPELTSYWDWRRDFFHRNPSIVPYLDDDFEFKYESPEAIPTQTDIPQYTFEEWSYVLGSRTVANVLVTGDIPESAEGYLEDIAEQLGIPLDELVDLVGQSAR